MKTPHYTYNLVTDKLSNVKALILKKKRFPSVLYGDI